MTKSRLSQQSKIQLEKLRSNTDTAPSISYFTLYRFASKWDKLLISISLIASFIAGATLPFSISLVANLFQTMINHSKSVKAGTHDDATFLKSMHTFGIVYSCIGLLLFVCSYLGSALMNITAIKQVYKIRKEYLTAVLNQDFAYFDLHPTGDFASKMADDVIRLEEGIGDKLSSFVHSATASVACILMAMIKGWKLALLCLTTAPVTFLLVGFTGRIADRLYKQEAIQTGLASSVAQEVLSSIRTVYAFNGQKKELERYQKPLAAAKKIYIKKEIFTGLSMGFLYFCIFCSYGLAFYFGIFLIIKDPDHYNADVMFSTFFGIMTALGNLGVVGSLVRSFGLAKGAGAQIFRLLDTVPSINPVLNRGQVPFSVEGTIELKNVVFHYPSRPDVPVLKGVTLTIKRGQAVAVVGHSGSGKSSVINLISRYYDVVGGSVCLDGIDVRELSVCWLRSQIGLVRQEPVLFNTTIRENIRYGRQSATDDEIEAAARQANAHQFIVKLPKMYETLVGERGTSLSGGQKQRIAIARALIRNPIVLLLDEATSALDTASEAKVQLAIKKAAEGRTTVVVAHRLSTIRDVDLIHVMKQGEIVETGTHEQLMAAKGLYFDMVMLQEPNAMAQEAHTIIRMAESSELDGNEVQVLEEEKPPEVPQVSFWRMIALNSKQWKWLTVGIVCSVFIGFSMPMFIVAFGDLFGSMSELDSNKMWEKVNKVTVVCSMIGAVTGICNLLEAISFGIAGSRLTERLRTHMFSHMLTQQLAYFDQHNNSTGALCAKLSSEASYVQGATGHRVGICLQGFGSIGLALVLAMWFEWRVGLVTLAALPLVALVVYQEMKTTREESYGNAKSLENSTKIAIEAVSNVRTVVSVGRERLFVEEYVAHLAPALSTATRSAHCKGLVEGLSRSMFNFINAAALTYGGHLMVNEGVAYENILVTTQSLQMASGQAQNAFSLAPHFEKGISAASRVIALLNTEPNIKDPKTPLVRPFISKGEASLKEVEFKYPSRPGVKVLRGLDLQVDKGKTIALVGRSGCGKSTVVQLLERFYDPDAGKVCLDDIPLRGLLISEARRSFGIVSQEPTLFDCSIAENIAYGDNETVPTHADIVDAAKLANIHNFVVSLPEGYDTNIGAKGTQLSGGQKQRVAIARALIRRPQILLLDEATSALDTESEKVVQESLKQAAEGRTCVMIAHRLSTVRDADLVCVIDAGVVSEAGSHQQLLDAKGLYYNLHYNS